MGEAAQRLADAAAAVEELQGRVAALEAELESQGQLFADSESKRAAAAAAVEQAANFAAHQQELMGQVEGRLAETEAEALALRQQLAERDAQLDGSASEASALREVRSGCQCRFAGLAFSWCRAAPRGGPCSCAPFNATPKHWLSAHRSLPQELAAQAAAAESLRSELEAAGQAAAGKEEELKKFKLQVGGWLVRAATACTGQVVRHVGTVWREAAQPAPLPFESRPFALSNATIPMPPFKHLLAALTNFTSLALLQLVKAKKLRAADAERCVRELRWRCSLLQQACGWRRAWPAAASFDL